MSVANLKAFLPLGAEPDHHDIQAYMPFFPQDPGGTEKGKVDLQVFRHLDGPPEGPVQEIPCYDLAGYGQGDERYAGGGEYGRGVEGPGKKEAPHIIAPSAF